MYARRGPRARPAARIRAQRKVWSYSRTPALDDRRRPLCFLEWVLRRVPAFFPTNEDTTMNSETSSESPFPTSSSANGVGGSGNSGTVQRMAQKAHEAVDRLEQSIGSGSETVMGWQQEYGEMAREQVKSNPLAAIGIAFGVGILFSKLFMR